MSNLNPTDPAPVSAGTPVRGATPDDTAVEVTLLSVTNFVLRHFRLILALPLAIGLIAVAGSVVLRGNEFVAVSTFLPQMMEGGDGGLSGLASQLGFRTPDRSGASPEFYAELLRSQRLLREAADSNYTVVDADGDRVAVSLADMYEIKARDPAARLRSTARRLSDDVSVSLSTTGIMSLTTDAPTPELAVQINRRLLDLVEQFNRERRQTAAKAERTFVEERYAEAQQALAAAESDLGAFLERNRGYEGSPQLMLEANRLTRRVEMRQAIASTLAQAYEQARIEEVRYTPVITLVDEPEGSATRAAGAPPLLAGMAGLLLGALLALLIAGAREYADRQRRLDPDGCAEFANLTRRLRRFRVRA